MGEQFVGGGEVAVAVLTLVDRAVEDVVGRGQEAEVAGPPELVDDLEEPLAGDLFRLAGDLVQRGRDLRLLDHDLNFLAGNP